MRWCLLFVHADFSNEKSVVGSYITLLGHNCLFIPKYHCELNRGFGVRQRDIYEPIVITQ